MADNFNRRRFLTCSSVVTFAVGAPLLARAMSIEPMTAQVRLEFANRCGGDANHEALMADMRAALEGKIPSEQSAALQARLDQAPRCPLCGCPMPAAFPQPEQK
jgi:hypothetical protein